MKLFTYLHECCYFQTFFRLSKQEGYETFHPLTWVCKVTFKLFSSVKTRRLWNFSSTYINVMTSFSKLFWSVNKKVMKFFIHLHECYKVIFKPFSFVKTRRLWNFSSIYMNVMRSFFCPLTRRLLNFSSIYMSGMNSLSKLFSSINKKVIKLFIHLHEWCELTFQAFFHPLTRRLWNFSFTYMSVMRSLSNLFFMSINKKITKLFIHLHEFYEVTFKLFFIH
jgi:hypothetical protein